jgi:hypothetical protein
MTTPHYTAVEQQQRFSTLCDYINGLRDAHLQARRSLTATDDVFIASANVVVAECGIIFGGAVDDDDSRATKAALARLRSSIMHGADSSGFDSNELASSDLNFANMLVRYTRTRSTTGTQPNLDNAIVRCGSESMWSSQSWTVDEMLLPVTLQAMALVFAAGDAVFTSKTYVGK